MRMQIFAEAQTLLPGGVNSPVRAFKSVGGQPIIFDSVNGPYCVDVDGNKVCAPPLCIRQRGFIMMCLPETSCLCMQYIDYVGSWGPAIVGHAHPEVVEALTEQIKKVRGSQLMPWASAPFGSRQFAPRQRAACSNGPHSCGRQGSAVVQHPHVSWALEEHSGMHACIQRKHPMFFKASELCTAPTCSACAQGTSYGAPCELENVLARIVIERVPCLEMVRFVSSGTEACLSVLRLMRAYTKRDKARAPVGRHPACHPGP